MYRFLAVHRRRLNWKQFLKALLILNAFWFVWGMVLRVTQHMAASENLTVTGPQSPDSGFNTCIRSMVNWNLQHYSGEHSKNSLYAICSSSCCSSLLRRGNGGMAAMAGIMSSISAKTTRERVVSGVSLYLSSTRILVALFPNLWALSEIS